MGKIMILSDGSQTYKPNTIIDIFDFIREYNFKQWDVMWKCYLTRIPMTEAVKIIANELSIEYEYV